MESEPPILLYLFSFALVLVTLARLHRQMVGRHYVQVQSFSQPDLQSSSQ